MTLLGKHWAIALTALLGASSASAITISNPKASATIAKTKLTVEVNGSCVAGQPVRIEATDSANKTTSQVWVGCESWGFSGPLNLSSLKDGSVRIRAFQVINNAYQNAYVSVQKGTVVVPPSPTPTPTPSPTPSPTPTVKISIGSPVASAKFDSSKLTFDVSGTCTVAQPVRIEAADSTGAKTSQVWVMCETWGFSGPLNISSLKDGNIQIRAFQVISNVEQNSYVTVSKSVAVTPTPTPTPSPSPSPSPTPSTAKILWGVNGHDIRAAYPFSQSEAAFKLLSERNLRTYRVDVTHTNEIILDTLIPLGKKYGIKLRPMLYPMTQAQAYRIAKKFGSDIEIYEIGNEINLYGRNGAQGRINEMYETYKGIKQAAAELGINIKISVNVTNCNSDDMSGRCAGDRNGDMWFLDMVKATGMNFDVVTYHYYPWYGNKGYWFDMYLGQMRAFATKYKVPIYLNETHCAEIYRGNRDGGYPGDKGCWDSMNEFFTEVTTKYSDIVQEINMYELFDEPYQANLEPVYESEAHFGLMYDINRPKKILDFLTDWAKKYLP